MKVVIGSVLKPLTDVRHYHKIALSLLKIPNLQVHILARNESVLPDKENQFFKPITPSSVSLFDRLLAPCKFLGHLFKIAPEVIIVCTHELLLPALLYKWFKNCVLIYDIQENYSLNILSNSTYNLLVKKSFSLIIRIKEKLISPFIDRFWLAEDCYKSELSFISFKYDVFENKSIASKVIKPVSFMYKESVKLIFSGTIAEENGIHEAIALADKLHQLDSKYSLYIIGCCHNFNLLNDLKKTSYLKPFITLNISEEPINYELILTEIKNSDLGLICYRQQQNFHNKIPTKLYEYLSLGLPIILNENNIWKDICAKYDAALVMNFNYKQEQIHRNIQESVFYSSLIKPAEELTWSSGEKHFINSFLALLPK